MNEPILHEVVSVQETNEDEVYLLAVDITDSYGQRFETVYCSRPDDPFGLNPTIRGWLNANTDFPVTPYTPPAPPTPEELREQTAPLTARQFRLGLLGAGKTPSDVTALITAMPAGTEKESAMIEWEYATTFTRTHPLVATLSTAMGFTPEEVDAMWAEALAI